MNCTQGTKTNKESAITFSSIFLERTDSIIAQIIRFGMVGAVSTTADASLLFILTHYLGLSYLISAAFGFTLGIIICYVISINWVFASRSLGSRHVEFIAFFVIGIIGFALTELILYTSVEALHLHYMVGKAIAVVLVFAWNYGARRVLLFRKSEN
ncbi:MAG: GtrA family protein [Armatimonadota bacterium]